MSKAKLNIRALLRALCALVVWSVMICLVVIFIRRGLDHHENLTVESLHINIVDSTSNGNLITTQMINQILAHDKIKIKGVRARDIPLSRIERVISNNGFVSDVDVYQTYLGELHIDIHQRCAVARILLNGYNCYISSDGYIFSAPPTTALYTPVITGSFKPHFPANFVGHIDDYTSAKIDELELEIERIEREKYPILQRERENNEDKREVRRRFINRSIFEDEDDFDKRVVALREENRKKRELYAYRQKVIEKELQSIRARQDAVRERQKKLQKSCDDIHNLITFVEMTSEDRFWCSEIVQIMLDEGIDDQLRISVAVRSGDFKVRLGTLLDRDDYLPAEPQSQSATALRSMIPNSTTSRRTREVSARKERRRQQQLVQSSIKNKLNRLEEFYKEALPRVGWDRYSEINIEFENQVVCKR